MVMKNTPGVRTDAYLRSTEQRINNSSGKTFPCR